MRSWHSYILLLAGAVGALSFYATRPTSRLAFKQHSTSTLSSQNKLFDSVSGNEWLNRGLMLPWAKPSYVTFSPSGKWCVGVGKRLLLWNTLKGGMPRVLMASEPSGTGFSTIKAYFVSENIIVVVTDHNVVEIDLYGRIRRRYFGKGTYRGIMSPSILPNRKSIALVMDEPNRPYLNPDVSKVAMRRLNLQTGRLSVWTGDFSWDEGMQMEIRKRFAAILIPTNRVFLLDVNNRIIWSRHNPHKVEDDGTPFFKGIAFTQNGESLIILAADGYVSQFDTKSLKETDLVNVYGFTAMALSPDGRFLVLGNSQGEIAVYNIKTRQLVRKVALSVPTDTLVFSPDGKRLAVGGVSIIPFDVQ